MTITEVQMVQGIEHEICEDYTMRNEHGVIVCDGCSNGHGPSLSTDWGSRILCKTAQDLQGMQMYGNQLEYLNAVMKLAEARIKALGLHNSALTATLLSAYMRSDCIETMAVGDGVFGGRKKDGTWDIFEIDFPSGAPFYLPYKYSGDGDDSQGWADKMGDNVTLRHFFGNPLIKDGIEVKEVATKLNLDYPCIEHRFPQETYDLVFVASDGVSSFCVNETTGTSRRPKKIDIIDVLAVLLDFSDFQIGTLMKQFQWNFRYDRPNTFVRNKWRNFDDLSMGVVAYG